MQLKKGKQFNLNLFNDFKITFGTVDNKNPKALYFTITSWAEILNDESDNFQRILKTLNKDIKKKTYDNLNKNLFNTSRTIVDFEIKESGISNNKRSFMNCEITLFKLNNFQIQEKEIEDSVKNLIKLIIEDVFNTNKHFKFHKKKI
jgi:hypothetical protein